MKTHISLNVKDIGKSVEFYKKFFNQEAQKQVQDYAKFDLMEPSLNLALNQSSNDISRVSHFGVEVSSVAEIKSWEARLKESGLLKKIESDANCCFAVQDKLWVSDPDGNAWEIFYVREQLMEGEDQSKTLGGCCVAK